MDNNKRFWQRAAKFYSIFLKNNKGYQTSFEKFIEILSPHLHKDMKALEIGCGIGQLSFLVADKVGSLIATDFSEEMIKICNKKNDADIVFKVEDGSDLSFRDKSFDIVFIANVLHIVPNPQDIINEIKRVLKDGGIIFAPVFIETAETSKKFNLVIWIMERAGFKTYYNTSEKEYIYFLEKAGLEIIFKGIVKSQPEDEFVVICKKKAV